MPLEQLVGCDLAVGTQRSHRIVQRQIIIAVGLNAATHDLERIPHRVGRQHTGKLVVVAHRSGRPVHLKGVPATGERAVAADEHRRQTMATSEDRDRIAFGAVYPMGAEVDTVASVASTTDSVTGFEYDDVEATLPEDTRRGEPGEPGTDYGDSSPRHHGIAGRRVAGRHVATNTFFNSV